MTTPNSLILLGPQRKNPRVREALDRIGTSKPVALIAAGWEEREPEHAELAQHLGQTVLNLEPYRRGEEVLSQDRELFDAMQARHDELRSMQDRYRLRLAHALAASRELFALDAAGANSSPDLEAAIEAVRVLDRSHLERVVAVHARFEERYDLATRPSLQRHRDELARLLEQTEVVCVAGGHVAILVNRMRLFGLSEVLADRPVIAWAAGAMALSERVVLFHDSPPQGAGDAEAFDVGFGLAKGIVCLPHASERLRLDDVSRVSLMARRFAPAVCATLDPKSKLARTQTGWEERGPSDRLLEDGLLEPMGAAC